VRGAVRGHLHQDAGDRSGPSAFQRKLAKAAGARSCEDAAIPDRHEHHVPIPSKLVPLEVRIHGTRAEVTLAPGRYSARRRHHGSAIASPPSPAST
jgi:hypothetical protein